MTVPAQETEGATIEAPGRQTRRESKRRHGPTRDRLLVAAREAFAERGFASTRVADIVALAGTSHGTFYTYFDDKRDALLALTQQAASAIYGAVIGPLANRGHQSPSDAIRGRIAVFLRTYSEWWDVVRTWDHASAIHPEVDEMRTRIRGSIVEQLCLSLARERDNVDWDSSLDLEVTAVALTAMVEEFASRWLATGRAIGESEIDQLTALWVGALRVGAVAGVVGSPGMPVALTDGQ
jgi:AcrR family transcriptional regulator